MTKRFLAVILSTMIIISLFSSATLTVSANYIGVYNDYEYEIDYNNNCTLIGYSGNESNIVIPSKIKSQKITGLGSQLFINLETLKSVTIPETIEWISESAFDGCTNLSKITFESKNGYKFGQVFNNTGWYKNQKDGVIFLDNFIYGFKGEISQNLTIPYHKDITYVGKSAFTGLSKLKSVYIPDNVTHIGKYAFKDCVNLKNVHFPSELRAIEMEAFTKCKALEEIVIPEKNELIDGRAFRDCVSLKTAIVYGDILSEAFWGIDNMKRMEICGNITCLRINSYIDVEELIIHEGLTKIEYSAIMSVKYLQIPKSVYYIDYDATACSNDGIIIYGYKNSCAEDFAYRNHIKFLPIHDHQVDLYETVEPNCTDDGYTIYKCALCDKSETRDFTTATGHNFKPKETIAPSSVSDGYTVYSCTECGAIEYRDFVNFTGDHNYEFYKKVNPTCDTDGYTIYKCTECDKSENRDIVKAMGHKYSNGNCEGCGKYIGSDHNYKDNIDQNWTITNENAGTISITFSELTETEPEYDFIYIYDKSDNIVGKYSGRELSNQTVNVKGNTAKIRLVSDKNINFYGFEITDIKFGHLTGDADSDGLVTIQDVTTTQRYIANQINLSNDVIEALDLDNNGLITINDVTLMQRLIAEN